MQQTKFLQNCKVARRRHSSFSIFFLRSRKVEEFWISSNAVEIPGLTASEFLIPPNQFLSQDFSIHKILQIAPILLQAAAGCQEVQ